MSFDKSKFVSMNFHRVYIQNCERDATMNLLFVLVSLSFFSFTENTISESAKVMANYDCIQVDLQMIKWNGNNRSGQREINIFVYGRTYKMRIESKTNEEKQRKKRNGKRRRKPNIYIHILNTSNASNIYTKETEKLSLATSILQVPRKSYTFYIISIYFLS